MGDRKDVPRGRHALLDARQLGQLAEPGIAIAALRIAAAAGPFIQVRQLHPQDRRLELVQPRVVAERLIADLVARAVEAQEPGLFGEGAVGGDDCSAVSEAGEVLGRVEGERGRGAECAGPSGGRARAGGLRGVLQHGNPERRDLADGSDVTEQMHRDHCLGAGGQRGADRLGGHAVGVGVDVTEHRGGAGRLDRLHGGVERERRNHHIVAGPDPHRPQRDRDGVGAVGDAHRVLGTAVGGELPLERVDLRAQDVALAVEHSLDRLTQLRAQGRQGSGCVKQRDGHCAQRERTSSRSDRVINRISSSNEVFGFQPRSRAALEGSPMRWSTSAGRTKAGSITT